MSNLYTPSNFRANDEENEENPSSELEKLISSNPFKRLYDKRVLYLRGAIEDTKADEIVAQLLALDADSDEDITLVINSPGGIISGMFAVYDVMHLITAKVNTLCVGMAASAGAFLLGTGTGTRYATPHSRIMIHQPLGGARGQATDIKIQAEQIVYQRKLLDKILSEKTGQPLEKVSKDTDRDFWMSAQEALEYGMIDEIRTTSGLL